MNKIKKTYVKPEISFVDFTLSASIAGACTHEGNFDNGDSCRYEDNGYFVFSEKNSGCDFTINNKEFCYHVPTADTSIFNS